MKMQFSPDLIGTPINDGRHINTIVRKETCRRHQADIGEPCFHVLAEVPQTWAVCNARAVRAGFNNPISEQSMRAGKFDNSQRKRRSQ